MFSATSFQHYTAYKSDSATMQSDPVATLEELSQHPAEDAKLRKDLYNAAMKLVFSLESAQDTAQRLYHGVSVPLPVR